MHALPCRCWGWYFGFQVYRSVDFGGRKWVKTAAILVCSKTIFAPSVRTTSTHKLQKFTLIFTPLSTFHMSGTYMNKAGIPYTLSALLTLGSFGGPGAGFYPKSLWQGWDFGKNPMWLLCKRTPNTLRDLRDGWKAELGSMRLPHHHRFTHHLVHKFGLKTSLFLNEHADDFYYVRGRKVRNFCSSLA